MMIEEAYIRFDTAELAKEKGFDAIYLDKYVYKENSEEMFFSCTQTLLQRWLREEHKLNINCIYSTNKAIIEDYGKGMYFWSVIEAAELDEKLQFFDTYEGALEVGLQETLKLIK